MKTKIINLLLLLFISFSCLPLSAQIRYESAKEVKGKLIAHSNTLQFLKSFKVLTPVKAASLANTADKIMAEIEKSPRVNPPIGFDAKINIAASDIGLKDKLPGMKIYCFLRNLEKNIGTGEMRTSEDGADLHLTVNDFDLFTQMGNFWEQCNALKIPVFFEQPALTDSTSDFISFEYKGGPIRIVTAGRKPLFVALTQKEFLQFRVAEQLAFSKESEAGIQTTKEGKETIKKMMKTENDADKAYSESTLKGMDDQISQGEKNISQAAKEIKECKALLANMSTAEANSPVRLNYNVKPDGNSSSILNQLVPAGKSEGVPLVKINPALLNPAKDAPVAEMLSVYYAWPTVGFTKDPNYVQQSVLDIFNGLDYHQLKQSLQ